MSSAVSPLLASPDSSIRSMARGTEAADVLPVSRMSRATGTWSGSGVRGPEAFDAAPFLELLTAYGSPWGVQELEN